ncbi:hypothetical protein CK203_113953 [Vitis vinifera]|uniref:Uncharacterized protein n=1 Tax=Vitis vinifera TaxID=29760 RepID=A0A438D7U0_VITVI|nr:hypothetical protein CK203_113953 [Vitis vinifera]
MHDLIQEMGYAIVREECPRDPHKWSRLWDADDIYNAFSRREGMENIQTISLDLSRSKEIQFSTEVFATMKQLRLLKIYAMIVMLKKIPKILGNMGHLKKLCLNGSGIKELPDSIGYLESLEILDLSNCSKFEKFPEIRGNMKCLKRLL